MGFSRQEYWRGLPCPPPGDLPSLGIKPASHVSCVGRQIFLPLVPTGKSIHIYLTALGSTVCPHIYMKISVNQVNKQSEYSGVTFINIGAKIRNNNYM